MQNGNSRASHIAEASLREMLAHLNIIDAGIGRIAVVSSTELTTSARDLLSRLELLAFLAARVQVAEVPRITDALEELVLAAQLRPLRRNDDVSSTLRHGVDVLMLLTHDAMRRMQGYPAAELRGATDALLERVNRLISSCDAIDGSAAKLAGL
jgi:hypothetical protein